VLWMATPDQLSRSLFPVGQLTKDQVRVAAGSFGLRVASKPDSYDICFIPDGDTRGWLAERVAPATGDILDRDGTKLGEHEGAVAYTVGQRRGLQIGTPADDGKPRFVLEVQPVTNTVVVGPKEALAIAEIAGGKFTWAGLAPAHLELAFDCHVQIRAHADPVPAIAQVQATTEGAPKGATELKITPGEPLTGAAPGQTAVLYIGTRVLGQCTIDRTVSAVPVSAVPVSAVPVGAVPSGRAGRDHGAVPVDA